MVLMIVKIMLSSYKKVRRWPLLVKYPINLQWAKFCLVGFTNIGVDLLAYWLLTRVFGLQHLVAKAVALLAVITWSFFLNRRWTFGVRAGSSFRQYSKFFIVYAFSLTINYLIFYLLTNFLCITYLFIN